MVVMVGDLMSLGDARCRGMFVLRQRVFEERLRWAVHSRDEQEMDRFDDTHAVYVVDEESPAGVKGCLRLRPTLRPYMLAQVFPQLLGARDPPCDHQVWEMSRFAFDKALPRSPRWGFTAHPLGLIRAAVQFAWLRGIRRYVLVTTVAVARMMAVQGLHAWCLGHPQRIGDVNSVAIVLEIDPATFQALSLPYPGSRDATDHDLALQDGAGNLSFVADGRSDPEALQYAGV